MYIYIYIYIGWCAPRLKDAKLSLPQLITAYSTIVIDMRRMYHECNLVHGDLSEYNLLWHHGRAIIIDVSQSVGMKDWSTLQIMIYPVSFSLFSIIFLNHSTLNYFPYLFVEHAHPYANDFLRKDACNITEFFQKRNVKTLSTYQLFLFITTPTILVLL